MNLKVRGSNLPGNNTAEQNSVRLQVYLARCGVASRRACETYIADGRVTVNGNTVTVPGTKVSAGSDIVCMDGVPVYLESRHRYILLNKPAGYVCSLADEKGRLTAADLLAPFFSERLYNIGRLDMFSSGLVLFTNDGDFAARIAHPSSEMEKEYIVETTRPLPAEVADRFTKGIRVDNIFYRCKSAEQLTPRRMRIILIEGKNREIRRVFEFFGLGIRRLTRVRIGPLDINGLEEGKFRELSQKEVEILLDMCIHRQRGEYGSSY